jgi:hypothetical protein
MNAQGKLVMPPGVTPPAPVPFQRHSGGPFTGPLF